MKYQMSSGEMYDLGWLSEKEREYFNIMFEGAKNGDSWTGFQNSYAPGVIRIAKEIDGDDWGENPLYKIQLDFVGRLYGQESLEDVLVD
ncbi:MAG: hypothetical protein Q8Q35_02770 [Nanoarchaeota archaeon]|nr:hypothetical protein [Nanoarchaeota archaeon]